MATTLSGADALPKLTAASLSTTAEVVTISGNEIGAVDVYCDSATACTFSYDDTVYAPIPAQQWFTIWERGNIGNRDAVMQLKASSGTVSAFLRSVPR